MYTISPYLQNVSCLQHHEPQTDLDFVAKSSVGFHVKYCRKLLGFGDPKRLTDQKNYKELPQLQTNFGRMILQYFCPDTFVLLQARIQSFHGRAGIFAVAGNGVLDFRLNHGGNSFQLLATFPDHWMTGGPKWPVERSARFWGISWVHL